MQKRYANLKISIVLYGTVLWTLWDYLDENEVTKSQEEEKQEIAARYDDRLSGDQRDGPAALKRFSSSF